MGEHIKYLKIKATFKGKSSRDYNNGEVYRLKVLSYKGMEIKKFDDSGICVYNSLSSFLRNWDKIQHIE